MSDNDFNLSNAMLKPSRLSDEQADEMSVGEELRNAREHKGFKIPELAIRLRMSSQFIAALEDDVYSELPEAAYVRGYIRSYARLLDLPADRLIDKFNQSTGAGTKIIAAVRPSVVKFSNRKNNSRRLYWLTLIIVMFTVFLMIVYKSSRDYGASPSTGVEKASIEGSNGRLIIEDFSSVGGEISPIVKSTLSFSEAPIKLADIEPAAALHSAERSKASITRQLSGLASSILINFSEECWIKVTDFSGGILHSAMMRPGESLNLSGVAPFKIVLGNSHGVTLNYNGEPVDLNSYQHKTSRVAVLKLGS